MRSFASTAREGHPGGSSLASLSDDMMYEMHESCQHMKFVKAAKIQVSDTYTRKIATRHCHHICESAIRKSTQLEFCDVLERHDVLGGKSKKHSPMALRRNTLGR